MNHSSDLSDAALRGIQILEVITKKFGSRTFSLERLKEYMPEISRPSHQVAWTELLSKGQVVRRGNLYQIAHLPSPAAGSQS